MLMESVTNRCWDITLWEYLTSTLLHVYVLSICLVNLAVFKHSHVLTPRRHVVFIWWPLSFSISHWGRVTHIGVDDLTIIGSDNGRAIIWTNVGILLIRTLRTELSKIFSKIYAFWFKETHLKMLSAKQRQFFLGLNVLKNTCWVHFKHILFKSLCLCCQSSGN